MPRRRRSFFFDNINKRLLVNTTKNTKQSKAEKDAGSMTDNDFLKKSEIDSAIDAAITGLIGGAPGALDTLDELSAALNDDSAFSTTVTNSLANKLEASDLTGYATETYVGQQITAAGSYSNASVDAHLNQSNPTSGYVLSWNGSDYAWIAQPTGFSGAYADLTGKPTIPTNNNQLTNGAGYITGITSSNITTALGYTPANFDHFRHTGHGHYTSTTTSALLTEALGDDAFDSKLTAHKTGWSYAGNGNLTDAGRLTELAGTSWLWWTDNSTDNVQGNITGLCIAPNTGGSAGKVFIYNNQGSGYSPGWREVWTSLSDGPGSGLDADTVDGIQGSSIMRLDASGTVPDGVIHTYECYGNIATSSGNQASLQCFNSGSGTDAFMTFHVGGDFAANLGVDGGINDLAYGGWSAGAASYRVYHAGNTPGQTITVAGIGRNSHHTGHLVGSYNSVGANSYKSNPIYTIGSNYNPSDAALGNMYGIGYSHTNASFIGLGAAGSWGMYVAADGDARIWLGGSTGQINASSNITAYASDGRLKTNVTPIENAIDKVKKIRGVTFDWVDNITSEYDFHPASMHEHGVIAQEIQEVIPDAVVTAPFNGNYARKSGVDHNFLTVDKDKIVPLLIEAIKEQQQQIEELKEMISGTSE